MAGEILARNYQPQVVAGLRKFVASKIAKEIDTIKAPQVIWKKASGFLLSQIKSTFIIPDFERKVSSGHVNKILVSILQNEFYDNIIRVIPSGDQYVVIDGQHRLAALWRAHIAFGLQKYDLLLGVYENEEEARLIYQKINSGQKLKITEMMKAIDDGNIQYFLKLREYCVHENSGINKLTYYDVLNGIISARFEEPMVYSVKITQLIELITSVTEKEIQIMKKLLDHMYDAYPSLQSPVYGYQTLRTLCHLHFKHNMTRDEVIKICNLVINNDKYANRQKKKPEYIEMHRDLEKSLLRTRGR